MDSPLPTHKGGREKERERERQRQTESETKKTERKKLQIIFFQNCEEKHFAPSLVFIWSSIT